MKIILVIAILCLTSTIAYGSGNHNHTNDVVINEITVNETTVNQTIVNPTVIKPYGAALGIASDHQFDLGTLDLQWSLSAAAIDKAEALSFGLARKPCGNCNLFTGALGIEQSNGKTHKSVSGSISGKF